jgi:hypothetical protein
MPSSMTSVKRTFGVNSERTRARSTPGRRNTSSVARRSASKNCGVKMFAVARDERDEDVVRAPELLAMLDVGLHVLVTQREQLGEARVDVQAGRGDPGHEERDRGEQAEDEAAVPEDDALEDDDRAVRHARCRLSYSSSLCTLPRGVRAERVLDRSSAARRPHRSE